MDSCITLNKDGLFYYIDGEQVDEAIYKVMVGESSTVICESELAELRKKALAFDLFRFVEIEGDPGYSVELVNRDSDGKYIGGCWLVEDWMRDKLCSLTCDDIISAAEQIGLIKDGRIVE